MKKWWIVSMMISLLAACSSPGSLTRTPQQDKSVFEVINKLNKNPGDQELQKTFESAYADAVLNHQQKITEYRDNNADDKWERTMYEYSFLNNLADAVKASPAASRLVQVKRYDEEYATAKQRAVETYYDQANELLNRDDRDAAKTAYNLLDKVNKLSPNYKNTRKLLDVAYNKSVLTVVVAPVNYYSQSYGYWGLNNDMVQQEIVRDLRYQLGSNVKVLTDVEARSSRIRPDRIIELRWDELYLPQPYVQTFSKQLSKQVQVGTNEDKTPRYQTVTAVLYVTRQEVRATGNLTCRITGADGQSLLWDNFPADYNWVKEYATYRGDSRALSTYEWSLINNSRMNNYSRRDIFGQVFRQVYPQLINRIRSLDW